MPYLVPQVNGFPYLSVNIIVIKVTIALAQIIWLLNDEIVTSLRSVFPVTEATLDRVTNHIRMSQSKHKMCQYSEVVLQFVFGAEKSLSLFIEV